MSDWTTIQIGEGIEIDLHYDLESFPFVIRGGHNHSEIVLSKKELEELFIALKLFHTVDAETWRKYLVKLNEST